jgi:UDP-N-acetylglucosamine 4-epimerase
VTGVAGFIGSAILEELLALGQHVVGLDNFATGHKSNLVDVAGAAAGKGSFKFIEGDIRDLDTCRRACDNVDRVLHQAALGSVPRSIEDPIASHQANVNGFLNMMVAARDAACARVVYASSSSVYGDHPALPKVEHDIGRQLSPYAVTKYIDELYAGVVQDCYELEIIGLRYFNVFGRRQDPNGPYAAVIPRWAQRLMSGEPCVIFGDGTNSRDFCYVDNAVQANILSALAPSEATNTAYNVGCGGRTDLNQLFAIIRDGLAATHPAVASAQPQYAEPRPGDVAHSQADISRITEACGYVPTHQIAEGLAETVRWFATHA